MKNKKTIIAIIGVLLILVVGVTFAYFQTTGTFENVFQTGTYRLVTTEVFESPDNWEPGETIEKKIYTKNEGTIPAAVRVSYTEQWLDTELNDITSTVEEGSAIINFDNTEDWILENGYYYYKYILSPNQTTSSFIRSVTLSEDLDEISCTTEGTSQVCESTNPALHAKYILTITKETIQVDKYSEWNSSVELEEKTSSAVILSGTKGALQPGDKVGIGETEDFYVISSDNSTNGKTVLLAKYNLLVGNSFDDGFEDIGPIPTNTPGYGLQNEASVGYTSPWSGGVYFSDTKYWMDGNNLKSEYSENDTIYYDSSNYMFKYRADDSQAYPYVYDENSNVYKYISGEDGYVNRLISMGAPATITGRLLSYEEAYNNKDVQDNGKSIILEIHNSLLGSADNSYNVVAVTNDYNFYPTSYNYIYYFGLRPVIEIYTSDIN